MPPRTAPTPPLLSFSGHPSVTSLARYARVSPEALRRWQQHRDPATRRPVAPRRAPPPGRSQRFQVVLVVGLLVVGGVEGQGLAQPAHLVGVQHDRGPPGDRRVGLGRVVGGSTLVITCSQHGTMRTGGKCGQCEASEATGKAGRQIELEAG
jgi:hypothetical protein